MAQRDVTKKELAAQSIKACLGSSDQKKNNIWWKVLFGSTEMRKKEGISKQCNKKMQENRHSKKSFYPAVRRCTKINKASEEWAG